MECDEQDEGTVGPKFQDDSTETPTWLREEVGLGSYQQAAREGKVFAQSVCSQKNLTFIVDQSRFSQSCSSALKDCINTAEQTQISNEFISQAKQATQAVVGKGILNSIKVLSSRGESFVDLIKLQKFHDTNLQQTNCGWIRQEC